MKGQTAVDLMQLERRSVDDPMETSAQLIAKRAKKPGDPRVGKTEVTGNAMTRIGALCFVRRRLGHHEKAAERFKNIYEGLYGSGMPAVDAGRIGVDCSIIGSDGGMAARLDSGMELRLVLDGDKAKRIRPLLSKAERKVVIAVVFLGVTCLEMSGGKAGRPLERVVDALLGALDKLSEAWGYGRMARERDRIR